MSIEHFVLAYNILGDNMNLPKRKPTRLKDYDYSSEGAYFITICTHNKKHLLGKIVGCGDFDAPQMILSEYGVILDKYIHLMTKTLTGRKLTFKQYVRHHITNYWKYICKSKVSIKELFDVE